jgi:hypothetical protein
VFWKALIGPLARTAIAAITPFLAIIIAAPLAASTWKLVGPVVLLAVVFAIANALGTLPDASGPWWEIALQRSARQAGQFFLATVIPGVLFSEIDWKFILISIALSALTTFVLAAVSIVSPGVASMTPVATEAPYPFINPAQPPLPIPAVAEGGTISTTTDTATGGYVPSP